MAQSVLILLLLAGVILRQGDSFLVVGDATVWKFQATITTTNPTNQDWNADQYHSQYRFVYEYGKSLVDLVDLQPGESVLDVGCGTGVLTAALLASTSTAASTTLHKKTLVRAIGIDADPNMIQEARQKFPNVDFRQGDARNFTWEEQQQVDVIFSNAALHWIPCCDMDRAVACMARALKPNGRFVVELGGNGNVAKIVAALQLVLKERHDVSTFECPWCFPTISDFTKHLQNNGIETLSAVLFDRPTVLEGADQGLNNWIRMFAGQFVGEYLDDEALAAVSAKLRKDLYDGENWIADYRRLRVIGRKL